MSVAPEKDANRPEAAGRCKAPHFKYFEIEEFTMLRVVASSLLAFLFFHTHALAAQCEVEAQVKEVMIQNCDGERLLGTASQDGTLVAPVIFDAIPLGIETFWSDLCQCDLWQVSGLAGAHTRIVRFLRTGTGGALVLIPSGEFGSEIGKISRVSQALGFTVEVRDSDVTGKRKTLERFRFDGTKFVKLK